MHFLPQSKETSRNSTIWTLHCLVIGKLNALIASKVSFFFLSIPCLEVFCNVPSRYNLRLDFFVIDTSLWTNQVVCLVFICSFLDSWFLELWKSRVLRDCVIIDRSCSLTLIDDFAKFISALKSLSDIKGLKLTTSKFTSEDILWLLIILNQVMTSESIDLLWF